MFDVLSSILPMCITSDPGYFYDATLNNLSSALDYGIMMDRMQTVNSYDSFDFNPYMSLFLA